MTQYDDPFDQLLTAPPALPASEPETSKPRAAAAEPNRGEEEEEMAPSDASVPPEDDDPRDDPAKPDALAPADDPDKDNEPNSDDAVGEAQVSDPDQKTVASGAGKAAVRSMASNEEDDPELPDFSGEPTVTGQYTLRIMFTRSPGSNEVLVATQSHDLLPSVQVMPLANVEALLAPFIAQHDALLPEIQATLAKPAVKTQKPVAKTPAKTATPAAAEKKSEKDKKPAKADKAARPVKVAKEALPQTSLFSD